MMKKGKTLRSGKPVVDAGELQEEVTKYASQLGLANGIDFAYEDFDPQKASKPVTEPSFQKGRASARLSLSEDVKAIESMMPIEHRLENIACRWVCLLSDNEAQKFGGKTHTSDKDAARNGSRYQSERNVPEAHDPNVRGAVRSRPWASGPGTRPGEKLGKSLLADADSVLWYELVPVQNSQKTETQALSEEDSKALFEEAEALSEQEAARFIQSLQKKSAADYRWLEEVRQTGTSADKLASLSLLIQESAVANLKSLDELLRWITKRRGARNIAGEAIGALQEIFSSTLLPNRKLRFFGQQPLNDLGTGKSRQQRLLIFYTEDAIKRRFLQYVKALQEASKDNLSFMKMKAMRAIFALLKDKPEQEAMLLSALVDKLGDPDRKVASNAGYLLSQLLEAHPAMKLVVVKEAEHFIFRPHLPKKAIYYAVVFINQLSLDRSPNSGSDKVAEKLLSIYFPLFRLVLEGKIGVTTVNKVEAIEKQKPKERFGKKSRQKTKKATSGKHQNPDPNAKPGAEDAKLLGAILAGVRRAFPFVTSEQASSVLETHSTDLFRLMHTAGFGVAVQALSLLFQLLDAKSVISDRFYRALYAMLLSGDLAKSGKSTMFLSLLFKALKADVSPRRTLAFVKRLLQAAVVQMPNFACGCILLVSELFKGNPALLVPFVQAEDHEQEDRLAPRDKEGTKRTESGSKEDLSDGEEGLGTADNQGGAKTQRTAIYDPFKRDPLHCRAELTCVWEVIPMFLHSHPSVVAMSRALTSGQPVHYTGDPVQDLNSTNFLDQFILKKSKKAPKKSHLPTSLVPDKEAKELEGTLNAESEEAADTAFFHKFFELKKRREASGQAGKKKKRKRGEEDSDEEGSLAGSEASSEAVDEFMDDVEEGEDLGEPGVYDDLAQAMNDRSGLDDTSDTDQDVEDEDNESSGDDILGGDMSGSEDSEDIDPFKLEGPTDEESLSFPSPESQSSSDGEWVMSPEEDIHSALHNKDGDHGQDSKTHGRKKRRNSSDDVFAPVEEYSDLISGKSKSLNRRKSKRKQR